MKLVPGTLFIILISVGCQTTNPPVSNNPPSELAESDKPTRCVLILTNVFFEPRKTALTKESIAELGKVVSELKQSKTTTLVLEGHACAEGTPEEMGKIALGRATSARNYMIEQGIEPHRVTAEGFGDSKPAVPPSDEPSQRLNRRLEFRFTR